MSGPSSVWVDPRRRLNAAIVPGAPPEIKTSATASSSFDEAGYTPSRFSQPLFDTGYYAHSIAYQKGLDEKRGTGLPDFHKVKQDAKAKAQLASAAQKKPSNSNAQSGSQGWGAAPVRMDDLAKSTSKSKSQESSTSSRSIKRANTLHAARLDEDIEDSSGDELQLRDRSPGFDAKEKDVQYMLFSSQQSVPSTSQSNKRKISSTKSQGATASPKKLKTSQSDDTAIPARRSKSSSGVKSRPVEASRTKSEASVRSSKKQSEYLPNIRKTAKPDSNKVIDISESSPAGPVRVKKKGDWSDNDEEISDVEEERAKPAIRKLKGNVRGMESTFKTKGQTASVSTMTAKSGPLSSKNVNVSPSVPVADSTPKQMPVRPRPSAKAKPSGVSYQSRERQRGSSTESEDVVVASSSTTKKRLPVRDSAADDLLAASGKENKKPVRPIATASLRQKKGSSGPSKPTFAKVGDSSSATKVAKGVSVIDLYDSPPRGRSALKETSPVRQSNVKDVKRNERMKGKGRQIADTSSSDDGGEQFGDSTQAMWIRNAFDGRDLEGELLPASQNSEYSDDEVGEDEDPFGERLDVSALCPFCDGPLPQILSKGLFKMLEKLCKRLDVQLRKGSDNPNALFLASSESAAACKRHRDEHTLIPKGLEKNYPAPSEIDFSRLRERFMEICYLPLSLIVTGAELSAFFETAKEEWEQLGSRAMSNIANQFTSFQQELPGYYGHQGFEILKTALEDEFVELSMISPSRIKPLDVESYLRRVLVPEAAIRLIQNDQNCDYNSAVTILNESRAYGAAVFGQDDSQEFRESKAERKERKLERQAREQERQAILDKGGEKARVLQIAQKAIEQLEALLPA